MAVTLLAVAITYWPLLPPGARPDSEWTLSGFDFSNLYARRLRYARELGGTPFWSNIQNFPLIPTRLPLLLMDPEQAFAAGVQGTSLPVAPCQGRPEADPGGDRRARRAMTDHGVGPLSRSAVAHAEHSNSARPFS
jgi:hypothetical protein